MRTLHRLSATIDTERFAAHFDDAPIIRVSGRTYPVEVRYRPLVEDAPPADDPLTPVLATGAAATAVLGDATDAILVGSVTVINALVSGLQRLRAHLRPGGVFAMWSDDPPDADFCALLKQVFEG